VTNHTFKTDLTCPVCFEPFAVEVVITVENGDRLSPGAWSVEFGMGFPKDNRCPSCHATWTGLELEALEDQVLIASGGRADRLAEGPYDTLDEKAGR